MKKLYFFNLLFFTALLCNSIVAQAIVRYVNANNSSPGNGLSWAVAYKDFQAAINASAAGDEVWVAAGTYQPAIGQSFAMKEGVKIYGGFVGAESGFSQRNWRINVSILKGNGSRVINNTNNGLTAAAILDGFTIMDGIFKGNDETFEPAAAVYSKSELYYAAAPSTTGLDRSVDESQSNFEDDHSKLVTGVNSVETAATAGLGGGVYNENVSPLFNNCIFKNNMAIGGDAHFSGSTGGYGGGMYNLNGSPTITNSFFIGNKAVGGADVTIQNAGYGGAIYNKNADTRLINCLFYNNVTENGQIGLGSGSALAPRGGAVASENGTLSFVNLTIYKNNTGLYFKNANVSISNTIIYENGSEEIYYDGLTPAISYSLIKGGFTGTGNVNVDPLFFNADNPDGADGIWGTADDGLRLRAGSPALNTGINMGAYEQRSNTIFYVRRNGTGAGESWATAVGSLQAAIDAAIDGDQIWVEKGQYTPASGESFTMKEGVKIYGGFFGNETSLERDWKRNKTELSGSGQTRLISNDNNGLSSTALLEGFYIVGGYANVGAGMYNKNSSPTIVNCIFLGNQASEKGGAIYNENSSPTIMNVVFEANETEEDGAAIYNKDSSPLIVNSIFFENPASRNGGGMFNSGGTAKVVSCLFKGNSVWTDGAGAAIFNDVTATTTIENSIVWGNLLEEDTPSAFGGQGTTTVKYSLIEGGGTDNGNKNTEPLFVDVDIPLGMDGIWGTEDDGLRLKANSPAIDAGSVAALPADLTLDISGKPRVRNSSVDMGPYESMVYSATVYVNAAVTSSGDGSTWANAFKTLKEVTDLLALHTEINEVRVASGTYYPTGAQSGTDRKATFAITRGNLKLIGGYDAVTGNRTAGVNPTVLSGDINATTKDDNSHQIMVIAGVASGNIEVDGFVFEKADTRFTENYYVNGYQVGRSMGAGLHLTNNTFAELVFRNCIFSNNSAYGGGGLYCNLSRPSLVNCIFVDNKAATGGGIYAKDSEPRLINCVFAKNSADFNGGAMFNGSSNPTIMNTIVWGNTSSSGAGLSNNNSTPAFSFSLVQGGDVTNNNKNTDPLFADVNNAIGPDGIWGTADDGLRLKAGSPAINAGSNAGVPTDLAYSFGGGLRIQDGTVDMGAYETTPTTLPLKLISFTGKRFNNLSTLSWRTANEVGVDKFIVEHRNQTGEFVPVATKVAKNGSQQYYEQEHYTVAAGTAYYRLKLLDADGTFAYSDVLALANKAEPDFAVYPNPTIGKVHATFGVSRYNKLILTNVEGKTLKEVQLAPQQAAIEIDLSAYPTGVYFIKLLGSSENVFNKIIKR